MLGTLDMRLLIIYTQSTGAIQLLGSLKRERKEFYYEQTYAI